MARKPAFLTKPLIAACLVVLLLLGGFAGLDWYLGAQLAEISAQPPRQAAAAATQFLRDYSWSRRRPDAEALLNRALGKQLDALEQADKHDEAAGLCAKIVLRHPDGAAADRCRKSQMGLRIAAARKQISDGNPDAALVVLQGLMRKGLKGAAKDLAVREMARARLALLTLRGEDLSLDDLAQRVQEMTEEHKGSAAAGLARDLLTCRRLRRKAPGIMDAEVLQAVLRCEALAAAHADTPSGRAAKAFVDALPGSVITVAVEVSASPKLSTQPPPDGLLEEALGAWLAAAGRGGLVRRSGLRAGFEPQHELRVTYTDKPGRAYKVAGGRKVCTRGRKMKIRLALQAAKGRTLWTGEFRLNEKGVTLPEGATAEGCPRAVLEGAMVGFSEWLAATGQPKLTGHPAWP